MDINKYYTTRITEKTKWDKFSTFGTGTLNQ